MNENAKDLRRKDKDKNKPITFETLYNCHEQRMDHGCITAPTLPKIEFNQELRGYNYARGLFAHMRALLICTNLCGTCGKNVHALPLDQDDTPNPWHQQHTPNPPFELSKSNVYCRCGNVYDYYCRPLYDYRNNVIPVENTTQQERLNQLCVWCKSFPITAEASLKVCTNI